MSGITTSLVDASHCLTSIPPPEALPKCQFERQDNKPILLDLNLIMNFASFLLFLLNLYIFIASLVTGYIPFFHNNYIRLNDSTIFVYTLHYILLPIQVYSSYKTTSRIICKAKRFVCELNRWRGWVYD